MKHIQSVLWVLLLATGLSGCLYDASQQQEASEVVQQLHDAAFKSHDLDKALAMYDASFFKEHAKDAWRQKLASISKGYGALKEVHPLFQQKDPRFRGDYYIFGNRLVFENGTLKETITVLKAIESDHLTIAGHLLTPVNSNS